MTVLVFTRPEAPLIVAACFITALAISYRSGQGIQLLRNLPIAAVPFIAFLALTAFRMAYFGDPLPNPFYAKTTSSSFLSLLNPFGGGWSYVLAFLSSSFVGVIILFLLQPGTEKKSQSSAYLTAVLVGHMLFVIWAKGDWMGQFRFIMPVVPIIAILAANGFIRTATPAASSLLASVVFIVLSANTVFVLNDFKAKPSTPMSFVSSIGHEFADVARKIGIKDPLLAHHDAGAIAFERSIRLIDLGGLLNRDIAKNMSDAAFLEKYILIDMKPDFVFGSHNFAARSGFLDSATFSQEYVPLIFVDKPHMTSAYSHIRRDRVTDAPGIEIDRDASGKIIDVVIK